MTTNEKDLAYCESCGKLCSWDEATCSEGCSFCPACWKEIEDEIANCDHDLEPYRSDAYADGLICKKCNGVFPKEAGGA